MKQIYTNSMGVLVWEASSNRRSSCFIRGLQTLENNKNLGATALGLKHSNSCLNYYLKINQHS